MKHIIATLVVLTILTATPVQHFTLKNRCFKQTRTCTQVVEKKSSGHSTCLKVFPWNGQITPCWQSYLNRINA